MPDKRLMSVIARRDDAQAAVEQRAVEIVRMWILRTGRAHVPVSNDRPWHALTEGRDRPLCGSAPSKHDEHQALDAALAHLPTQLARPRPDGPDVILADLNVFLGRAYNDRWGPGGRYYPPKPPGRQG
ncbi:MAG: hypothetical protein AB7G47_19935 [Mycolicibacterium sp.]|uniref:hypothetical protein n=1 Tax=Mycolicibacterium sp. TaxID=2320850 RepID=UPI003D0C6268